MLIVTGMASIGRGCGLFQQGSSTERGAGAAAPGHSLRAFGVAARPGGEGQSHRERARGGTHVAPTFGGGGEAAGVLETFACAADGEAVFVDTVGFAVEVAVGHAGHSVAGLQHGPKRGSEALAKADGFRAHELDGLGSGHDQQFGQERPTQAAGHRARGDDAEARAFAGGEAPTVVHGAESSGGANDLQPFRVEPTVRATNDANRSVAPAHLAAHGGPLRGERRQHLTRCIHGDIYDTVGKPAGFAPAIDAGHDLRITKPLGVGDVPQRRASAKTSLPAGVCAPTLTHSAKSPWMAD